MKICAFILSAFLMALVAGPILSTFISNNETAACCVVHDKTAQTDSPENKDNGCCDGSCNPLTNCCGLMGFLLSNHLHFDLQKEPTSH